MALDDLHRALLQTFLSHRVLALPEALDILHKLLQVSNPEDEAIAPPSQSMLTGILGEINDELSAYDLEIKWAKDQTKPDFQFAIINLTSDPLIHLATAHSPEQIMFFKRLLDAMFETNNQPQAEVLALRGTEAMNLHKPAKEREASDEARDNGLTMRGAEEALAMFVEERWLEKSKTGWYSLSTRALMELQQYLVSMYNDQEDDEEDDRPALKKCAACSQWLTVGQRCDKMECPVRVHNMCAEKYFTSVRGQKCGQCETPWSGDNKVGEKAAGKLRKKVSRRSKASPHQEEEEVEDDAEMEGAEDDAEMEETGNEREETAPLSEVEE